MTSFTLIGFDNFFVGGPLETIEIYGYIPAEKHIVH